MQIKTKVIAPTNQSGEPVKMTAQETARNVGTMNPAYTPVAPGTYFGVVTKMATGTHRARSGANTNPNSVDGLWEYYKLIPEIKLLTPEGTIISNQEFTLGVMENGEFVRPDGKSQSPIWLQGQFLLTAMGCFKVDPDNELNYELSYDDETIVDRVARFKVGNAAYIKEPRVNLDMAGLVGLLKAVNGGKDYSFEQMFGLVQKFNEMSAEEIAKLHGFDANKAQAVVDNRSNNGNGYLKVKNVVIAVYPLTPEVAAENDWFYDDETGAVFTNPAAWAAAKELEAAVAGYTEPNL